MTDILHQLYSTPLLQTHVAVPLKVLEYIKSQKFRRHDTGYMTQEKLLDDPLLKGIKKLITQKVEDYFYNYCGYAKIVTPVHVSSWANLHKKGDWGQQHSHYNSVVSGVWELSTTPESGEFIIHPDNKLFGNLLDLPRRVYNEFNGDQYAFTPTNGDLLIFPSTIKHSDTANKCDIPRFSLAFNYMIRGDVISGKGTKVKL